MAKDHIDELEKKKQELEAELNQIQQELDNSLDQVRSDVSRSLAPKEMIRKYPLPVVSASMLLGFLIGHRGKSGNATASAGEFSGALVSELKKLATKKAISFATDYVEEMLEKKADEHLSSTNGQAEK
ncbi:MAG TPA: hypothetical protein VJ964_13345 [Balneolaceae bacterium]|nr:hypothetical protein [Balneolaceae bacterium]